MSRSIQFLFLLSISFLIVSCGSSGSGSGVDSADLSFVSSSNPTTGEVGDTVAISVKVTSLKDKHNVYVDVGLVLVTTDGTSASDITSANYSPDFVIGALYSASLDANAELEITGDLELTTDIPTGTYAVVFRIDGVDYTPDDDHLQEESSDHLENNFLVSSTNIEITTHTSPQLFFDSAEVENSSFFKPTILEGTAHGTPDVAHDQTHELADFVINAEIGSEIVDVVGASISLDASLSIPGTTGASVIYPLNILHDDNNGKPVLATSYIFDVDPVLGHSLEGDTVKGFTFQLYLSDAAWAALASKTADTTCELKLHIDSGDTIAEHNGEDTDDNVKTFSVIFLVAGASEKKSKSNKIVLDGTEYSSSLVNKNYSTGWGNSKYFKSGIEFGVNMSYHKTGAVPTAADANVYGQANLWVFKKKIVPLFVGADAKFDIDDLVSSRFIWEVQSLGVKQLGKEYSLAGGPQTIWEKSWSKSISVGASMIIWAGPVPVTIEAGGEGTIGIGGALLLEANNVVALEFGPFASVGAFASAGVDLKLAGASVNANLTLLEVKNTIRSEIQIQTSGASFSVQAPLVISTLDGKFYLKAYVNYLFGKKKWKKTLLKWDGYSYTKNYFSPRTWKFP
ncbi:MAG: hypothetical protein COA79_17260 [Planctomycetota bacterium]|nr:MAG: hypothetical protein COA79_17260 [Planctomycetota bacterium]